MTTTTHRPTIARSRRIGALWAGLRAALRALRNTHVQR